MSVKKLAVPFAALLLLAACGKKEEPQKAPVSPAPAHSAAVPAPPAGGMAQAPSQASAPAPPPAAQDPHAGLQRVAVDAGTGRKGRVVETMNAAGYTYLRVDEKGKSTWVAVMEMPVKVGDVVEFPDIPPMTGFHSRTLNRTFDSILFVPGLRVEKKK
jgi:hypothetical protein